MMCKLGEVRHQDHVRAWCGRIGVNKCLRLACGCITRCLVLSVKRMLSV